MNSLLAQEIPKNGVILMEFGNTFAYAFFKHFQLTAYLTIDFTISILYSRTG
jgi:hypothetical protein